MGSIRISSDIPGPRSRALTAAAPAWVARPLAPDLESVVIARGEGAVVEDVDANRYLDLTGGACRPAVPPAPPQGGEAPRGHGPRLFPTRDSLRPPPL